MSSFRKIDGSPLWNDDYNKEIIDDEIDDRKILSLYDYEKHKRDCKIEKEQLDILDNVINLLKLKYQNVFIQIYCSFTYIWMVYN